MDTGTGAMRQIPDGERPARTEVVLSQAESAYLELLAQAERPEAYKQLHSHNNSKRRRSLRRMQNLSRRKNRT